MPRILWIRNSGRDKPGGSSTPCVAWWSYIQREAWLGLQHPIWLQVLSIWPHELGAQTFHMEAGIQEEYSNRRRQICTSLKATVGIHNGTSTTFSWLR